MLISLNRFSRTRLMTSSAMMVVIVLTWLFGVLAVNNTEDKIYHYFFIMFYTFQVRGLYLSSKDFSLDRVAEGRVVELLGEQPEQPIEMTCVYNKLINCIYIKGSSCPTLLLHSQPRGKVYILLFGTSVLRYFLGAANIVF